MSGNDKTFLGMKHDTLYVLIAVLLLMAIGALSFHYYVYVTGGNGSALHAGTGVGFTLFPGRKDDERGRHY